MLELRDVACHYDLTPGWADRLLQRRKMLKAVDGVSFTIHRGETFALVGESGCGKSTIAKLCVGLAAPSRGSIRFAGTEISQMPRTGRIQMIFQDPSASLNPRWRAAAIIGEPLRVRGLSMHRDVRQRVDELLEAVGLTASDGDRYPHEFSGGQRQRISIARALAGEPELLICDEPTSALDVSVQAQILNLMTALQRDLGLTYLFISHNLAVVSQVADTVGVMYLGRLVETAPVQDLFEQPRHPYTKMLFDAVPSLDSRDRLRPLTGEPANALKPPSGCAFHPRCGQAVTDCTQRRPELRRLPEQSAHDVSCHLAIPEPVGPRAAMA